MAIGYLVWEIVSLWINRKLAAEQTAAGIDMNAEEPAGGEGGGVGGSRLSTVLPLLLNVLKVVIFVIFALIGLAEIGVDTTPLLAGAGIVGLAIGFGAQKLVTDVVFRYFFSLSTMLSAPVSMWILAEQWVRLRTYQSAPCNSAIIAVQFTQFLTATLPKSPITAVIGLSPSSNLPCRLTQIPTW